MEISVEELQALTKLKALAGIETTEPMPDSSCDVCDTPAVDADIEDMQSVISAIDDADVVDAEEEEIEEWANSPSNTSEPEERELELPPGETVDISLRRHLGADPKHVKVEESDEIFKSKSHNDDYTSDELSEAYAKFKKSPISESVRDFIEYRDPEGCYIVVRSKEGGYKIIGKNKFRGEFTHAGKFDDVDSAVEHAELTCDGVEDLNEDDSLSEYKKLLKSHDWSYDRSDSHSKWTAGHNERTRLEDLQAELDPDASIWNTHAPDEFKKKQTSTRMPQPTSDVGDENISYRVIDTKTGDIKSFDRIRDASHYRDTQTMKAGDGHIERYQSYYVTIDPETGEETPSIELPKVESVLEDDADKKLSLSTKIAMHKKYARQTADKMKKSQHLQKAKDLQDELDGLDEGVMTEDSNMSPIAKVRVQLVSAIEEYANAVEKLEREGHTEVAGFPERLDNIATDIDSIMKSMGMDYASFYENAEEPVFENDEINASYNSVKSAVGQVKKLLKRFRGEGIRLSGVKQLASALKSLTEIVSTVDEVASRTSDLSEGPWDAHNVDVRPDKRDKSSYDKQPDSPGFVVRNKRLKKRSKKPLPSWNDAMALVSKLGGRAEGWEVAMESASHEKGIDDKTPVEVSGVKGANSKSFTKKFKSMNAYNKWLEKNGDDYEVSQVKKVDESSCFQKKEVDENMAGDVKRRMKNVKKAIHKHNYGYIADSPKELWKEIQSLSDSQLVKWRAHYRPLPGTELSRVAKSMPEGTVDLLRYKMLDREVRRRGLQQEVIAALDKEDSLTKRGRHADPKSKKKPDEWDPRSFTA